MPILLLLLVSVVSTYFPDPATNGVKIVSRQVTGGVSDFKTEYLTANRMRNEWQTRTADRSSPQMASIITRGSNQVFLLDLQAREYVTYDSDGQSTLGSRSRPMAASGGILQIWINNVDTGERLMMFGHMARHIVTRESASPAPALAREAQRAKSMAGTLTIPSCLTGTVPKGRTVGWLWPRWLHSARTTTASTRWILSTCTAQGSKPDFL